MNSSFLYHAWGLYTHEYTCEENKGNRIILHVQAKERISCCPSCGARSYCEEWVSPAGLCRTSHRWQACNHTHEGATL